MYQKKCTIEPPAPPPEPTPCQLQKIKQILAAGKTCCPKKPQEEPEPPPPCHALCIERVKNPPLPITCGNTPTVCVVEREVTGTARCDAIAAKETENHEKSWADCHPKPAEPPPPPPPEDPCIIQARKIKKAECMERNRRYFE